MIRRDYTRVTKNNSENIPRKKEIEKVQMEIARR
jgi:hypothetical protein